jgi:hypothetical protein
MRGGWISTLDDVINGLQLALRGRIRLRADLLGFDDQEVAMMTQTYKVVEDVMWYAVRDVGEKILIAFEGDEEGLLEEVDSLLSSGSKIVEDLESSPCVSAVLNLMDEIGPSDPGQFVHGLEDQLKNQIESVDPSIIEEYRFSALELLANALLAIERVKLYSDQSRIFIPKRMES